MKHLALPPARRLIPGRPSALAARLLLILCACALGACATQAPSGRESVDVRDALPGVPGSVEQGEPASRAPQPPATPEASLLASVDAAMAAGRFEQAAALCERALRISPRDGHLWYRLASIRYRQQRYGEAAGLARRALSLAGQDRRLIEASNALLEQAEIQQ